MSTCRRCHRSIRDSWAISPACLKREQLAAMERAGEGYSQAIRDKATALLTSEGVQHQAGGLYLTRASDGKSWYRTSSWDCRCLAGQHDRACAHRLAVAMFEAVLRVGGLTGPFESFKTSRKATALMAIDPTRAGGHLSGMSGRIDPTRATPAYRHCPACWNNGCDVSYLDVVVIQVTDAAECDCMFCHGAEVA